MVNKIPYRPLKWRIKIKEIFHYKIRFILFNGSWWGNGLPSLRSIATFERTYGHIGNEKPQIAYAICSQES